MHRGWSLGPHLIVDEDEQGVWRHGQWYPLPIRTYRVLHWLLTHPQTIVPYDQLLAVGWPGEPRTTADLFRHIHRLRAALEEDPRHPRILMTRRQAGYVLQAQPLPCRFALAPPEMGVMLMSENW